MIKGLHGYQRVFHLYRLMHWFAGGVQYCRMVHGTKGARSADASELLNAGAFARLAASG